MKATGLTYGIKIIELIMENGQLGFNDLKQSLQLTPSSLNRYLQTLLEEEFILKAPNQKYVLGRKITAYSQTCIQNFDSDPAVYPILETIARTTPFTALWIKFDLGKMICRQKAINPNSISMQEVGEVRTDYLYHPWGYLLLGTYNEKEQARLIKFGHHSSTNIQIPGQSTRDLWFAHIREYGYADDQGKVYEGIRRLAFPYNNEGKYLTGAIALGAIESNVNDSMIKEISHQVREMIGNS